MKWWKNDAIIQRKIKNLCSYAFYYKVFKMIYKLENVSGFILIYHTAGTLLLDPFIACRTIKFGVADVKKFTKFGRFDLFHVGSTQRNCVFTYTVCMGY